MSNAPLSVIHFYLKNDEYGCFSNFAPYPIRLGGKRWPTSEHYFQAQKFAGTEYEDTTGEVAHDRRAVGPIEESTVAARLGQGERWDHASGCSCQVYPAR